jgi:hypothetical protein
MHGDCVEAMRNMAANVFDAIVCDPPYGLEFMGKEWDRLQVSDNPSGPQNDGQAQQEWHFQWAKEAIRVLKPGGHLVAFGGSRTYHRLACALEDAGFEIRDSLMWLFTTGFPKSVNVAKAIDAAHGVEPEVVAIRGTKAVSLTDGGYSKRVPDVVTVAVTEEAKQWEGWGTALKPAFEPIVLARKPLEGTLVNNIRKWGTGALNIGACRIGTSKQVPTSPCRSGVQGPSYGNLRKHTGMTSGFDPNTGRWPSNVVFDKDSAALLEEQKPGTSRFFYCPKVSRKERDAGCEMLPDKTARETVERDPTSPGARNPRAGAGRVSKVSVLDPTTQIKYPPASWVNAVLEAALPADMVQSLKKVTVGSTIRFNDGSVWSMCWCGSLSTDPSRPVIKSIIETAISSTIQLKTWSFSRRFHTNGCMADAFGVMAVGGNPVGFVGR